MQFQIDDAKMITRYFSSADPAAKELLQSVAVTLLCSKRYFSDSIIAVSYRHAAALLKITQRQHHRSHLLTFCFAAADDSAKALLQTH